MDAQLASQIAQGFDLRALPAAFLANPYPVYAALREREPVRLMPDGSYFITRHTDLTAVYRDAATFSSDKKAEFTPKYNQAPYGNGADAPLLAHHTTSLVFNDPPLHTRVRKLIMGGLTRRAIAQMEDELVTLVDRLLDHIQAQGGGDVIEDFAAAIPVEVIGNLLNIPHADRAPLRAWSLAILGALEPKLTAQQEAAGNQAVSEFSDYLKQLIAHRRAHPGNPDHDVLTRLIQGEGGTDHTGRAVDALSEAELVHNCIFILNAGHETTTNLIGNALVALQTWPDQKARLLSNMRLLEQQTHRLQAYLDTAVDEFLRFEPSNQLGNRRATRDCTVGGVDMKAGSLITLCIAAANRDPAVFEHPDVLKIQRVHNKHLAFGFGIHQCAGLSLARLEGRIAIGRFVQRFPNYCFTADPVRSGRARFRGFLQVPFACA
jgi:cytochrome P450